MNLEERNADIIWMTSLTRGIIISIPTLFKVSIFQGFPEHLQTVAESRNRTYGVEFCQSNTEVVNFTHDSLKELGSQQNHLAMVVKRRVDCQAVFVHTFNSSASEAEVGGSL